MKLNYGADFILGVCGTVFGAAFLYQSGTLMYPSKVFPVFIAVGIIVISVLITLQGLFSSPRGEDIGGTLATLAKPVAVMLIAAVYLLSISYIGFYVASFLCIMVLSIVTTRSQPTIGSVGATTLAALVYLGGVYFVFSFALGSSIPRGILF
jgi:hypothetical protein